MYILWFLALAISYGTAITADDLSTTIQALQSSIQAPTALPDTVAAQLPDSAQKTSLALDERSQTIESAKQAIDNAQTPLGKSIAQQQLLAAQQTSASVTDALAKKVEQLTPEEQSAYAQAQADFGSH